MAGVETLVSTRLDPGVDPIVEADRRGTILAIIRVGNKDLRDSRWRRRRCWSAAAVSTAKVECSRPATARHADGLRSRGLAVRPERGRTLPPRFVAGMTAPQYGMPITGTPIGLPGPPHIPMGIPAGLAKPHDQEHTKSKIPGPVKHFRMNVKQEPGFSYPTPPDQCAYHRNDGHAEVLVQATRRAASTGMLRGDCDAGACDDAGRRAV